MSLLITLRGQTSIEMRTLSQVTTNKATISTRVIESKGTITSLRELSSRITT
jgi:hypothetical protein